MRIDWELATVKPNRRQKIEGKYLLDLRTKIYDLEHELSQSIKEIEQSKEKLTITEQSFKSLTDKFIASEQNMNEVISDLKKKLRTAETKVTEKVDRVDLSLDRITDLEQKIVNKDNELMRVKFNLEKTNKEIEQIKNHFSQNSTGKEGQIEELRSDLERTQREVDILKQELEQAVSTKSLDLNQFKIELEQKNKQIQINKKDLDHTILTKDSIIAKLEKDLEEKINQIEELNNNIDSLYTQISNVKEPGLTLTNAANESDLLKRIKELMDLKGFITDKELEQLQL